MRNALITFHTFHLQYKHSSTFANRTDMKNCLTPKNPKMCDIILVTLLKMRLRYSQSSRDHATPSISTSPLASCKKLSTPPRQPQGNFINKVYRGHVIQLAVLSDCSVWVTIPMNTKYSSRHYRGKRRIRDHLKYF